MTHKTIHFAASNSQAAQAAFPVLTERYGQAPVDQADIIVALGGDGFMLHMLHDTMHLPAPVYGMNRGSVGFMMNDFHEDDLLERLNAADGTGGHRWVENQRRRCQRDRRRTAWQRHKV